MKKKIYLLSIIIFIIDLISKQIIINTFSLYQSKTIISNFFYLTYVKNTGAAFSILKDKQILLLIITAIALYIFNKYITKDKFKKFEYISYPLILGGIIGNMFDRLIYGYVIDFFDFRIFGYNYPVFNLADSFIVIGAIIFIIGNIKGDLNENRSKRKYIRKN